MKSLQIRSRESNDSTATRSRSVKAAKNGRASMRSRIRPMIRVGSRSFWIRKTTRRPSIVGVVVATGGPVGVAMKPSVRKAPVTQAADSTGTGLPSIRTLKSAFERSSSG